MTTTPKIDPEFAALIPPLSPEDAAALSASIKARGCLDPLVVWDGILLDGHNRLRLCTEYGLPFATVKAEGITSRAEAKVYICERQVARRNLPVIDRIAVVRNLTESVALAAKERQATSGPGLLGGKPLGNNSSQGVRAPKTVERVAAAAGVSHPTLKAGEEILDFGAPELQAAVRASEISISAGAKIAALPKEEQPKAVEDTKRSGRPHRARGTGKTEWFTPPDVIQRVKLVLSEIDLDPSSCVAAQKTVGASAYFTKKDNGLVQTWTGRVFMNPPYTGPLIAKFAAKLVEEIEAGHVTEAVALVHNSTETAWFQSLAQTAAALHFPNTRIVFVDAKGKKAAPMNGQCLFYFGRKPAAFRKAFPDGLNLVLA